MYSEQLEVMIDQLHSEGYIPGVDVIVTNIDGSHCGHNVIASIWYDEEGDDFMATMTDKTAHSLNNVTLL